MKMLRKLFGLCNPKPLLVKDSAALINDGFAVFEKANAKVTKGIQKADEELAEVENAKKELEVKEEGILAGIRKAEKLKGKLQELLGD